MHTKGEQKIVKFGRHCFADDFLSGSLSSGGPDRHTSYKIGKVRKGRWPELHCGPSLKETAMLTLGVFKSLCFASHSSSISVSFV